MVDSEVKICLVVYHIYTGKLNKLARGVLNQDLTVWQGGARPPSRYISKYIKLKLLKPVSMIFNLATKLFSNRNLQIVILLWPI